MIPCSTPILLLAWRRPHTLRLVVDAIRRVTPSRLFVACDGPNPDRPGEAQKVAETRAIIDHEIDWPCQVKVQYSETNHGCRDGVSSAISWFFEEVEEGIILEDDCVPHPDFFSYCTTLLERYRHDTRIWSICGSNFQLGNRYGQASYFFSIHGDSWGWASWRRAWQHYHSAEQLWFELCNTGRLLDIFPISTEQSYWKIILDKLFIEGTPSSWAYQWFLTSWMNNGLHAWPNVALVSNKGYDFEGGTHPFDAGPFASADLQGLGIITHPTFVLPSRDADEFAFLHRRFGLTMIDRKKYGSLYSWVLRLRKVRKLGFVNYVVSKIKHNA
jgi:hypothetical protein